MLSCIAILGSGDVGKTLGAGYLKYGYKVTLASRDPAKLADWKAAYPEASIATFAEAAAQSETIVLAVAGGVASAALEMTGAENLKGKVVIDASNPIDISKTKDGIPGFFAGATDSLMETLQEGYPEARFVKAFNSVGHMHMVNPQFDTKPTMFICGNDMSAKTVVTGMLDEFGWETEDMGTAAAARAIEPLAQLWCIPIFKGDPGKYAFKWIKLND